MSSPYGNESNRNADRDVSDTQTRSRDVRISDAEWHLYFPTVSRRESIRQEGRSFIDRLFGGDAGSMLLHFAESTELSAAQRDELRATLDRMEQEPVEDDS